MAEPAHALGLVLLILLSTSGHGEAVAETSLGVDALLRVRDAQAVGHEQSGGRRPANPSRPRPNLVGSGLRMLFHGAVNKSYCLVSDPCIHVNALMDGVFGDPTQLWVRGYGVRVGQNSVTLLTTPPTIAQEAPPVSFFVDGKFLGTSMELLKAHRGFETRDGALKLEKWGAAEGAFLITAPVCGVRLLIFVKQGWASARPRLSLDVLDWDNLDAPHGIIGQIFPNRADPSVFLSGSTNGVHVVSHEGTTSAHRSQVYSPKHWKLSTSAAIRRLYGMQPSATVLDGLPEDYATSDLSAADCIFSRFMH